MKPIVINTVRCGLRVLALAALGYGVFAAVVSIVTVLPGGENQVVYWDSGFLCSLAFALSDFVVVPAGKKWGFLRRLIVSATICTVLLLLVAEMESMDRHRHVKGDWPTLKQRLLEDAVYAALCVTVFLIVNRVIAWRIDRTSFGKSVARRSRACIGGDDEDQSA